MTWTAPSKFAPGQIVRVGLDDAYIKARIVGVELWADGSVMWICAWMADGQRHSQSFQEIELRHVGTATGEGVRDE